MKVIAFYNIKGGVGKTSTAVNLAWFAAQQGLQTLLWDLDAQAAAGWYLGADRAAGGAVKKLVSGKVTLQDQIVDSDYPRLSVVPGRHAYRNLDILINNASKPERVVTALLKPLKKRFDLVVLDCPPSASALAESMLAAADAVMVPLIPAPLSLRAWQQVQNFCKTNGLPLTRVHPFFNMVDRRRALHRQWLAMPPQELTQLLGSYIPYAAAVERMGVVRKPVAEYAANQAATVAYGGLWQEIYQRAWRDQG